MSAIAQPSLVSQVLRLLPGPLLRALDGWSQRVARRRREERLRLWEERKAARTASVDLHLKVFGD